MSDFQYATASSADDASAQVKGASDGSLIAGGMTLIPSIKLGLAMPTDLIDLAGAGLSSILVEGSSVSIGAMTRHADVAASKEVLGSIPALATLASGIGDPQVRNRGTIGGSVANNDPAADYPSACVALNAKIHTNSRKIEASKFFSGMFETSLKKGELIEAVEFQIPDKSSYQKHPNPASRYAVVGVYVAKNKNDVNVAVTGAKSCVYKDENLSKALSKNFSISAIDGVKVSSSGMNTDIHASAEYRASLVATYTKKAVEAC